MNKDQVEAHILSLIAEKNVELVETDNTSLFFRCKECGAEWSPNLQEGGTLPSNYWVCPNECNNLKKVGWVVHRKGRRVKRD